MKKNNFSLTVLASAFLIQMVKISQTENQTVLTLNLTAAVVFRVDCVLCLWELYILFNLNITDICSLGMNNHSCELNRHD